MLDINTIFAQALQQAVEQALAPLLKRIEKLEAYDAACDIVLLSQSDRINDTTERIVALENNPAIGVDTTLAARVTKLENEPYDKEALVAYLSQQEWFWAKLQNFVDTGIEKSMDNHLECYNHDDYDDAVSTVNDYDFDDFLTKDDLNSELRDQINDTLSNASISISV